MQTNLIIEPPNEKQKLFLLDHHRVVGFGGARGGGKSWVFRAKAKLLALKHGGITIVIVRKTYPELTQNHIEPLCNELNVYSKERLARYSDKDKTLRFDNGSRIIFRYCDTEKDADRFQGLECDVLMIDEATQITEEQYKKISATVRGVNNFPKRIYLSCNPGGVGHEWVKRLFIDRNYKYGENPDDYSFIQSLVTDNKALLKADPQYYSWLQGLPPTLRKAWLNGEWDIFQGAFFEEFRTEPSLQIANELGTTVEQLREEHRFTHCIDDFMIPSHWKIYRSYDFGYSKPFSFGYWALDTEGVAYRIAEFYGCTGEPNEGLKIDPYEQMKRALEFEKNHPNLQGRKISGGVADPAIWNRSAGESVADIADKHRIYFEKGDNSRVAGWMQVHYRMAFDKNGFPRIYFFNSCKNAIRTIPLMMYDEHKPEDLNTELEDHISDDIRYFCMMNKVKPIEPYTPKYKPIIDPLNQLKLQRYNGG